MIISHLRVGAEEAGDAVTERSRIGPEGAPPRRAYARRVNNDPMKQPDQKLRDLTQALHPGPARGSILHQDRYNASGRDVIVAAHMDGMG